MSLSMKSDYVFCEFFSRKGNEEFLKDFLMAILNAKIKEIEVIQQAHLGKISKANKHGVIDLKVTLNSGIVIDVEMQVNPDPNWEKRVTYYAGKLIASDLSEGEEYGELKDIVIISILNYNLTKLPEYITESVIVAKAHRNYELVKGLKYYFIELPKFRKENPNMNDKLNQWLAFIDGENRGLIEMAKRTNEQIDKAVEEFLKLSADKEVVEIADARLKSKLAENSMKNNAKREGRAEGLAEGLARGLQLGKKEEKEKIAREMLKKGMKIEEICELIELSEEEVEQIKT